MILRRKIGFTNFLTEGEYELDTVLKMECDSIQQFKTCFMLYLFIVYKLCLKNVTTCLRCYSLGHVHSMTCVWMSEDILQELISLLL